MSASSWSCEMNSGHTKFLEMETMLTSTNVYKVPTLCKLGDLYKRSLETLLL